MSEKSFERPEIPPEQVTYANLLYYGSWIGLAALVFSYIIYIGGVMTPYIPISKIPDYWAMSAQDYVHTAGAPTGWEWLGMLKYGDFLNFIGIAFLAGLTILCFLSLLPSQVSRKDTAYFVIAIAEIIVLTVAASGILKAGGH